MEPFSGLVPRRTTRLAGPLVAHPGTPLGESARRRVLSLSLLVVVVAVGAAALPSRGVAAFWPPKRRSSTFYASAGTQVDLGEKETERRVLGPDFTVETRSPPSGRCFGSFARPPTGGGASAIICGCCDDDTPLLARVAPNRERNDGLKVGTNARLGPKYPDLIRILPC